MIGDALNKLLEASGIASGDERVRLEQDLCNWMSDRGLHLEVGALRHEYVTLVGSRQDVALARLSRSQLEELTKRKVRLVVRR